MITKGKRVRVIGDVQEYGELIAKKGQEGVVLHVDDGGPYPVGVQLDARHPGPSTPVLFKTSELEVIK